MTFLSGLRARVFQLALAALPALGAVPANAGDIADIEIYGFSVDGYHFAFEQFGVQDGSGFPYSDIFVLDVRSDSWVPPSPFRLVEKEDKGDYYEPGERMYNLRQKNQDRARETLANSRIDDRGRVVGHNPVTEIGSDPHRLSVNPRAVVPPIDAIMNFYVEEYPLPSAECSKYGVATTGFRLTLSHEGKDRILNEDTKLPKSRGCPLSYRIERVVTYYPAGRPPVFAALIYMETKGFEGPSGRYLAITGQI